MDSNESKFVPLSTLFLTCNWYYRKRIFLSIFKFVCPVRLTYLKAIDNTFLEHQSSSTLAQNFGSNIINRTNSSLACIIRFWISETPLYWKLSTIHQFYLAWNTLVVMRSPCESKYVRLMERTQHKFLVFLSPRFLSSCAFSRPIQTRDHNYGIPYFAHWICQHQRIFKGSHFFIFLYICISSFVSLHRRTLLPVIR